MRIILFFLVLVFLECCQQKKETSSIDSSTTSDSTDNEYKETIPENWDLEKIYGLYFLDSSTGGFAASLTIQPQGSDLAFTVTSKKGETCKGEVSSSIAIVSYGKNYHTGYSIDESCKLEFIFRHTENKIDVREIQLCTSHDPLCGFEGTYSKQINN